MAKSIIAYNNCSCGTDCEHHGKPHYMNDDNTPYLKEPFTLDYYLTVLGLFKDLDTGITSRRPILRRSAYHFIIPNDAKLEGL